MIGAVLVALMIGGGTAAGIAIYKYGNEAKSVHVNLEQALSGDLPSNQKTVQLDDVEFSLRRGDQSFTSDVISARPGHHLVEFDVGYRNLTFVRAETVSDVEIDTVRVETSAGEGRAQLLTADGVAAPVNVVHGQQARLKAYFEIGNGESLVELRAYPDATSARHIAWVFDQPSAPAASVPRPTMPAVRQVDQSVRGCGTDASVTPTDNPIGRTYRDGDDLSVSIDYDPGTCTLAGVSFRGYFPKGSPWYDHWCGGPTPLTACDGTRIAASFVENAEIRTQATGGSITLKASPGPFPPPNASTPPNLDGFHLCGVDIFLHDDAFGGNFVRFALAGPPC